MTHPLDRPIWSSLRGGWAAHASGDDRALRLDPGMGPFAAAADTSTASLAALAALSDGSEIWLAESEPWPAPPGFELVRTAPLDQMVSTTPVEEAPIDARPLGDEDAAEMQALAALTKPGPFAERTHRFGGFRGVFVDGRLVAMAGERMQTGGFSEVSGLCTHPDFRGRGYGERLLRAGGNRIHARGATPFLHVYPDNEDAIALYERLGYRRRTQLVLAVLRRRT